MNKAKPDGIVFHESFKLILSNRVSSSRLHSSRMAKNDAYPPEATAWAGGARSPMSLEQRASDVR